MTRARGRIMRAVEQAGDALESGRASTAAAIVAAYAVLVVARAGVWVVRTAGRAVVGLAVTVAALYLACRVALWWLAG